VCNILTCLKNSEVSDAISEISGTRSEIQSPKYLAQYLKFVLSCLFSRSVMGLGYRFLASSSKPWLANVMAGQWEANTVMTSGEFRLGKSHGHWNVVSNCLWNLYCSSWPGVQWCQVVISCTVEYSTSLLSLISCNCAQTGLNISDNVCDIVRRMLHVVFLWCKVKTNVTIVFLAKLYPIFMKGSFCQA
jgi:hypothetical protein